MADILKLPGSPRPSGYSDGIAARGRFVFTAGIVGWNPQHVFETDDFVGQARQAFANIAAILAEGGAKPEHLVRLTWYVRDKHEYLSRGKEVGAAYREVFGRHFPAMAVVEVSGLMEERARLEIEATAVVPD
jgi:enamine deaminase RidA (YjgF/YER057c/UK114 family)